MRMRQKVSTSSSLPIRLGLSFLLIVIPQLLFGQELNDTIRIDSTLAKPEGTFQHSTIELLPKQVDTYSTYPSVQTFTPPRFSLRSVPRLPYTQNPSLLFKGDYSTGGVLHQFAHGSIYGSGSQTSMAGIGRFNNASLGYQHVFNDKFEMMLNVNAMKINMSHITGQAFSTSGALLYHASDRVTFKVFGSYDIGNNYGMSTHRYGASMKLDMSDRFGMEMGVQRYYDDMSGRWETVPMVIPYYHFEKFTLGLDVGGIIYEVLRDVVFDKNRGLKGGPTIEPPRLHLPIR